MASDKELFSDIPAIGDDCLFQSIVESIASAVFVFQGESIRYVNLAAQSITDYSKEELLAMPFWAIIHEDFQDLVKQRGRSRQAGDDVPASYDVKIVRKDGETRWVNFRASMIELDGKPAVLGLAEDINERKQAEAARQESNDRLDLVLGATNDGIWDWNMQTGEVLFSPRWKASLGYSEEEVPNHVSFWKQAVHPDDMPSLQIALQKHFDGETACYEFKNRLRMKNGAYRWNLDKGKVVQWDADGKPLRMVGSDTDITERIQNDERLKQYEHQRIASIKLGQDALAGLELDDLFQKTTEVIAETLDVELCKILELQPGGKLLLLRAGVGWKPGLVGHASVGTELESQAGYTLKSNHPVIVKDLRTETRFSGPPLLCNHGVISGISVIIGSIDQPWGVLGCHSKEHRDFGEDDVNFIQTIANTLALAIERKQVEQALSVIQTRHEEAQRIAHVGHWTRDLANNKLVWSDEVYQIFDVDSEKFDASYETFLDAVHSDDREFVNSAYENSVKNKTPYNIEHRLLMKNGSIKWVNERCETFYDDGGAPLRSIGTVLDITKHKQAEQALRESEEKYRGMVMNLMEGFYRVTLDGKIQDYNVEFTNILGLDPNKDYTGIALPDFWQNPEDRKDYAREIKAHGFIKNYTVQAKKVDGEKITVLINARLIKGENSNPLLIEGSFLDITERKRAEELVHKLSNAVTHAGGSIMITNRAGTIEYVNPAFTKITGYSAKEAIGQTPKILNSGNQDTAFYERMWHTITSGNVWHGKVIDKRKDGSFFPAMLTIAPIADDKGLITHFVGSHADISELEEMEAQFHQAQKMEAIGTLVGGIAHDFNNMLAGMTGNIYLSRKYVGNMPEVVQKLDNVETLAMRAADMIQQLLTFARKDRVSIKRVPFTPFIKETLKFLRPSVSENIAMQQDICSEPLTIDGDATQLHQVLMNLVNNARDALEGVASPCITTRLDVFHANAAWVERHAEFTSGLYVHLSVADNGCGIPEHQIEHLFEPFFTTKEVGKGTGLGLAMVFGAIKTHNGIVDVESVEGEGSTFHVYLPLPEPEEVLAAMPTGEGEVCEGNGEMILLADDEQHILDTGKEVLESLGYRVVTACNGQQAIELFAEHADTIDLCLFDVVMPVMGGDVAAQHIRQIKPDVKIIFATGYDKNRLTEMAHETVLNKPFSIVEMSRLIKKVLDI